MTTTLVHIAAVVNLSEGSASIDHVTPLPGKVAESPAPGKARLAVRTVSARGATREHAVTFKPDLCRLPEQDETGLIDAVLNLDSDAALVEVVLDGKPVASFEPGPVPRAAESIRLRPRRHVATDADDEEVPSRTLSWKDPSPRGKGHHSYIVQASTDQGATWTTLALGLADTSLAVDPTDFGEADHVRFRVFATNGLALAAATTDDQVVANL
jgi:hypothetical protein